MDSEGIHQRGDGMRPARAYEGLTAARKVLFDWVRPLSQEHCTQRFPFGMGSIRATLIEIAGAEWGYGRRLRGEPSLPRSQRPINETTMPRFADLEPVWTAQAKATLALLQSITDWDRVLEATAILDGNKRRRVSGTLGDFVAQLLFHEVHHRAQVMAMLRQLGVPAQDLDYGSFMLTWSDEPA
jgi:uncharacterized damage-inducible protein DinB